MRLILIAGIAAVVLAGCGSGSESTCSGNTPISAAGALVPGTPVQQLSPDKVTQALSSFAAPLVAMTDDVNGVVVGGVVLIAFDSSGPPIDREQLYNGFHLGETTTNATIAGADGMLASQGPMQMALVVTGDCGGLLAAGPTNQVMPALSALKPIGSDG